jgi:acetylornithine deacetylase/succinyl-diaminopimelate desuccinylase-like protein
VHALTDQELQSTITYLQDLIRINTVNPPGNEIHACRYIADLFDKAGIEYQILESAPHRANLIARLKGDGSRKPLLLTSHLDVVPCEEDKWDVDPFSGVEKDGFIWGRGAVDMKNMTAMALTTILKAKREGVPLKRDLIFAAIADEEVGCTYGSKWLVENHADLLQAEYALNEVGGFSLTVDDKVFYPIGVGEKGLCWFDVIAKGETGHGSMPHNDQAVPHVCFATHKLADEGLPHHETPLVTNFVENLAKHQGFPKNIILKAALKKSWSRLILKYLFPDKDKAKNFENMLHNTATPTKLNAGYAYNVIPSEATLSVDGRILPGHTVNSFLQQVRDIIGNDFEIKVKQSSEPFTTEHDNSFFEQLGRSLKSFDSGSIPVPFLIPGYTDAQQYQRLGIKCYGFVPVKLPADINFGSLYHGHNERIPVNGMKFGMKVLWDVILKTCC